MSSDMVRYEVRSQLYGFLCDATANPDGDEWDHDRLRVMVDKLVKLPAIQGLMVAREATFRERYELQRQVEAVRALAAEMEREDPQISTRHIAMRICQALGEEAS